MATARPWWQSAVIYQVYPRSFQDSNGDGIGDLAGIVQRVDYLAWLGIGAVWLSPIYPSPMADFGYDISDYTNIDPIFGTLEDFDRLVDAFHAQHIRVILDFVPNHSSIAHPWFQESRSSRASPKRDWYIWRDPARDGGPPNNWLSQAGGIAWTFDPPSGQYYYHAFLSDQPDLNWRNPEVRQAMHEVLRFWLRRGVDGFRVDVLWHLAKDPEFRDDPPNPNYRDTDPPFMRVLPHYSADYEGALEIAAGLRSVLEEFPGDRVLIGELSVPLDRLMQYYRAVHLPANFALLWAAWTREIWTAERLRALIAQYENALPEGAWPNWVIGNHDQPRVATRLGPGQARVAMVLLLTLRGTPIIYYADELGHPSVPIPLERVRDPFGVNMPGGTQGRDPVRTPMPWDGSPNGGFTTGEPWLPLASDPAMNVAAQKDNTRSMLALTHALLQLRRREPALLIGDWAPLDAGPDVLAYERRWEEQSFTIVLNLTSRSATAAVRSAEAGRIVLSTTASATSEPVRHIIELSADEGVVIQSTP